MPHNELIFTQMPTPMDVAVYDEAREWVVNHFSNINDVIAVYEYGTVNDPGISDLDLMVVLNDEPQTEELYKKISVKRVPDQLSGLINDASIKIINRPHFKKINRLGKFRNNLLWGEEIKFHTIPSEDKILYKIASVMDFLPERVLSLLEHRERVTIPVHEVIGLLQSYLYSAKATEKIIAKPFKDIDAFAKELKTLRETWFQNSSKRTNMLKELINQGIDSGIVAFEALASYLKYQKYYLPLGNSKGTIFYLNQNKGFSFYSSEEDMSGTEKSPFFSDGKNCVILKIPGVWLTHFYYYAQQQGVISSNIRNNLIMGAKIEKINISNQMAAILSKRISLCNEIAAFFIKHRIPMDKLHRFAHIQRLNSPDKTAKIF